MDGWGVGGLGHWSLCCAKGVSGVLALTGGLGVGQMQGRGGVVGWGVGGHLRER